MTRSKRAIIGSLFVGILVATVVLGFAFFGNSPPSNPPKNPPTNPPPPPPPPPADPTPGCKGTDANALCYTGTVDRIVDGDTIDVADSPTTYYRIRLVLVDAPEVGETGYQEAKDLLASTCSVGSQARVDEDDWQIGADPYGRVLAVVTCGGTNANAVLIASAWATTYTQYCSQSEFGEESWSGCSSPPPPPPPPENCDPSYPTVCIPSPPPDLDCADIPHQNFQVLPPDPHHFDWDGDGIGCEA